MSADGLEITTQESWIPDGVNCTGPDGFGYSLLSADNYFNLADPGICAYYVTSKYPLGDANQLLSKFQPDKPPSEVQQPQVSPLCWVHST